MKTALIALALLPLTAGAATIGADFPQEVAAQCAKAYPDSYRGQEHCIRSQTGAALAIIKAYRSHGNRAVIATCLESWRVEPVVAKESYDYRAARRCIDGQKQASR